MEVLNMVRKFSACAIYNGTETILRDGKEIKTECIGIFDKDANTLTLTYNMFESSYQRYFRKVFDDWFPYILSSDQKCKNRDWKDEDGIPYANQEEFLHYVTLVIDENTIKQIKEVYALLAYGSDKSSCPYSDYRDVFSQIMWTSDDSILKRWEYFHK